MADYDDPDSHAGTMTITIVSGPSHGKAERSANCLYYTPDTGYTGPDSFTWKISDGIEQSATATCSITFEIFKPERNFASDKTIPLLKKSMRKTRKIISTRTRNIVAAAVRHLLLRFTPLFCWTA